MFGIADHLIELLQSDIILRELGDDGFHFCNITYFFQISL